MGLSILGLSKMEKRGFEISLLYFGDEDTEEKKKLERGVRENGG